MSAKEWWWWRLVWYTHWLSSTCFGRGEKEESTRRKKLEEVYHTFAIIINHTPYEFSYSVLIRKKYKRIHFVLHFFHGLLVSSFTLILVLMYKIELAAYHTGTHTCKVKVSKKNAVCTAMQVIILVAYHFSHQ